MADENISYTLTCKFFQRVILRRPGIVVLIVLAATVLLGLQARNFRLDASAETLVLEGDKDLAYSREVTERYGQSNYLIVTFRPKEDLFSDEMLTALKQLRDELRSLESVESVRTILDVPLLGSASGSLENLKSTLPTLESGNIDREEARRELSSNGLYNNLLLSEDSTTTALLVLLESESMYLKLWTRRTELKNKLRRGTLTSVERGELDEIRKPFYHYRNITRQRRHENIEAIRRVMNRYRNQADVFLGGVSMIADDLILYIKDGLKIFGVGVLLFMTLVLGVIFRRIRWIVLPVLCCLVSVVCTVGLLGWLEWEVTVISSNFISLQLVLTMAIAIHLVVRYRERLSKYPDMDNSQLVLDTIRLKMKPCVYAVLTTIAGFSSLIFCNILPVIMFGWMMTLALLVSLAVSFLLFPAALVLLPKDKPAKHSRWHTSLTGMLAWLTERYGKAIMVLTVVLFVLSGVGMTRLRSENCFVDYFRHSTEIYRGMKIIDRELGGTTPLDVIVDLGAEDKTEKPKSDSGTGDTEDASTVEPDEFGEFDLLDETADKEKYWFTAEKIRRIKEVHNYLESLPQTGKVMSFATLVKVVEKIKGGELDSLELALLYNETPAEFREMLVKPYVSVENNEVRFWVRVRDSDPTLRRDALLKKIEADLNGKPGLEPGRTRLTGLLVLYNNMLQSLFRSQILTLGITISILSAAFWILFRSFRIGALAIVPNIWPIALILGIMGWLDIPLDMMTITIAAISMGIAVDNTIHYIQRFKEEFEKDRNYIHTMHRCHASIGRAMYYTSLTIIGGFSILTVSNFVPVVSFGLLTSVAMLIALIADLALLPYLLIALKPFGPESVSTSPD